MCCFKIVLKNSERINPALLTDGRAIFDYESDLISVEAAAKINALSVISKSGYANIQLLATANNFAILSASGALAGNSIGVDIETGFSQTSVVLKFKTEGEEGFLFEVTNYSWQDAAKDFKIWDIEGFDPYVHSEATIDVSKTDGSHIFTGSQKGYWFPELYFGGLHKIVGTQLYHTHFDYRPIISRKKILESAFCKIGYKFVSDIQDGFWKGRDFDYLAGINTSTWEQTNQFYNLPPTRLKVLANPKHYAIQAEATSTQTVLPDVSTRLDFANEILDTGGTLNTFGFFGSHQGASVLTNTRGKWKLKFKLLVNHITEGAVIFYLREFNEVGSSIALRPASALYVGYPTINYLGQPLSIAAKYLPSNLGLVTYEFELFVDIASSGVALAPFRLNFCIDSYEGATVEVLPNSTVEGVAEHIYIADDAFAQQGKSTNVIVFPQSYIDKNLTLIDYIQGIAHQVNGFVTVDEARKIIKLEPTSSTQMFDDYGLYGIRFAGGQRLDRPSIDLSQNCDVKKILDTTKSSDSLLVGYGKESGSNAFAKSKGSDFYSYVFGLTANETKENRNPLYEPALDGLYEEIAEAPNSAIYVPRLLDNDSGALSTNLAFFCLHSVSKNTLIGTVGQSDLQVMPQQIRKFRRWWNGAKLVGDAVAYASASPKAGEGTSQNLYPAFLSYGIQSGGDASAFARQLSRFYNYTKTNGETYIGNWHMSLPKYNALSFSDRYMVRDENGQSISARLVKKGGYNCDTQIAELEFEKSKYICFLEAI